jgi:hypothetical protein
MAMKWRQWLAAMGGAVCLASAFGCQMTPADSKPEAGLSDATGSQPGAEADPKALDGGGDAAAADGACHPGSTAGFQPAPGVSTPTRSQVCNGFNGDGGLVQSYRDACLGHASGYPPCASFDPGDAAGAADCFDCLVAPAQDGTTFSGVVAFLDTIGKVNYPVCIKLVDPSEAGASCASALEVLAECLLYACQTTCGRVTDDVSAAAFVSCYTEATYGACLGHALETNGCLATEQGDGGTPVAQVCFPGSTPQEKYLSFAHYLCGGD